MSMFLNYIYTTEKVGVRPLEKSDIEGGYRFWFNDPEVCQHNSHAVFPMQIASLERFINSLAEDKTRIVWAICDLKNNKHIGNVSLQSINLLYRNAEFAIIIGEKDYWGKGYAFDASKLIVEHGFKKLNLHRIYCGTAATNLGMIKLAAKLKMRQEGIRRQALFLNGEYVDMIEFGVLRDEYFS